MIAEGQDASAPTFQPSSTACSRASSIITPRISPIIRGRFRSWKRRSIELAAAGYRLAVCTNKLEWLSLRLLETLDLTRHFAAICGQDTFGMQKPDPEVLRRTIRKAGGEPGSAIMVGDSGTDVRTARNAALPVIAVTFGYSEVPIESLRPDRLISSYGELAGRHRGDRNRPGVTNSAQPESSWTIRALSGKIRHYLRGMKNLRPNELAGARHAAA